MRLPRLLLAGLVLAPVAAGCQQFNEWRERQRVWNQPTGPMRKTTPEELVGYLNARADYLQTLEFSEARLTARQAQGLGILSYSLRGSLAASRPRNFRLKGTGSIGGAVDLGSNGEQFWVYVEVPSQAPVYVYASHTDFQSGQAPLPGNVPFEPEWVMQGLGMTRIPEPGPNGAPYTVTPYEKDRTYVLSWPAKTPTGAAVRREVVFNAFDAFNAGDGRPQVKQYVVRDPKTNKALYSADVKAARSVQPGSTIQYPTHIVLRSDDQKFELDLTLDGARLNQQFNEQQMATLFSRPTNLPANGINLAEARFRAK